MPFSPQDTRESAHTVETAHRNSQPRCFDATVTAIDVLAAQAGRGAVLQRSDQVEHGKQDEGNGTLL